MLPDKNGVYMAHPTSLNIEEKATGTVQANIVFNLTEYRGQDGRTADAADAQITGYFNLITKKGALNEINARALRDALGWDGASFATLASLPLDGIECQVVIGEGQDQNGSTRKEVKYLNPRDYAGRPQQTTDANTLQSLDAKYGSMLRATAGAAPSARAAATTRAPVTTAKPAAGATATDLAKQTCYAKFISRVDDYGREDPSNAYSNEERTEVFRKLANNYAATINKQAKDMTPAEFAALTALIEKDFSPALRDIVPF